MRAWLPVLVVTLWAPLPATAFELHRPFGAVSVETSYDDHISGRSDPEVALYPSGNKDWRGSVSLGGGTDLSFGRRWSLYLGGRLRAFRYLNYPDFSGMVGTLTTELSGYALPLGIDAFLSYGFSSDGAHGRSHTTALSLEKPIGSRLTLIASGGHYWHGTASMGLSNRGPFADGGLRLALPTRTSLTALASVIGRSYDYGREDRVLSGSLSLSQRLWAGNYLRASFRHDRSFSNEQGRNFPGNAFTLGTSTYF